MSRQQLSSDLFIQRTCGGGGVGGGAGAESLHWGVQAVRPMLVGSRRRWFRVLWNLECPVGLDQTRICAHFNERNLAQFGRSAKINSGTT